MLLGVFQGDVVLGQPGFTLPLLEQYESDLPLTHNHEWIKTANLQVKLDNTNAKAGESESTILRDSIKKIAGKEERINLCDSRRRMRIASPLVFWLRVIKQRAATKLVK